jgi:hypothetical protein
MEHVSSISTGELKERWEKMRKWKKPTYDQMMEYLRIYSELEIRNAI